MLLSLLSWTHTEVWPILVLFILGWLMADKLWHKHNTLLLVGIDEMEREISHSAPALNRTSADLRAKWDNNTLVHTHTHTHTHTYTHTSRWPKDEIKGKSKKIKFREKKKGMRRSSQVAHQGRNTASSKASLESAGDRCTLLFIIIRCTGLRLSLLFIKRNFINKHIIIYK